MFYYKFLPGQDWSPCSMADTREHRLELQDDKANINSQISLQPSFIKFSKYLKPVVIILFPFNMVRVSRHPWKLVFNFHPFTMVNPNTMSSV